MSNKRIGGKRKERNKYTDCKMGSGGRNENFLKLISFYTLLFETSEMSKMLLKRGLGGLYP